MKSILGERKRVDIRGWRGGVKGEGEGVELDGLRWVVVNVQLTINIFKARILVMVQRL